MAEKKSLTRTFSVSPKVIKMLERMAEDWDISLSGVLKILIVDAYNKRYCKDENTVED